MPRCPGHACFYLANRGLQKCRVVLSRMVSAVKEALLLGTLVTKGSFRCQGASLVAQTVRNLPPKPETRVRSLGGKDHLEGEMAAHSVFLPGESHGQRSLADCSPWGRKESDVTEWATLASLQAPVMVRSRVMEPAGRESC